MNKLLPIFLSPYCQYDSKRKGAKIMEIYAPWGAIT